MIEIKRTVIVCKHGTVNGLAEIPRQLSIRTSGRIGNKNVVSFPVWGSDEIKRTVVIKNLRCIRMVQQFIRSYISQETPCHHIRGFP